MRRSHISLIVLVALIAVLQWQGLSNLLDGLLGGIAWSTGIVEFLRDNTQGLIILFLLGLFFEFKESERDSVDSILKKEANTTSYNLLKNSIMTSEGSALAQLGLSKLYGDEAAKQLIQNLFVESDVLKNLDVTLIIQEITEEFLINVELSYETSYDRFLVAVSRNTGLIEKLLTTGEVNEAFYSNAPNLEIPATIKRISEGDSIHPKGVEILGMEKSSANRKHRLARKIGLPKDSIEDFELFEEKSSNFKKTARQTARFVVNYQILQSKSCPYIYWMNDRISLIRQIKLDVKSLSLQHQSAVKIHRFMALSRWRAENTFHNGICVMPLELWSVPGDGIVVTWFEDMREG